MIYLEGGSVMGGQCGDREQAVIDAAVEWYHAEEDTYREEDTPEIIFNKLMRSQESLGKLYNSIKDHLSPS